jgi:TonB family protein
MRTFLPKFSATMLLLMASVSANAETRITTAAAMNAAQVRPAPVYPPVAKQMRVQGKVEVEVTIDTEGSVGGVKALTGNALLTRAAMDAVKQWKFTPFSENGTRVDAVAVLSFEFKN